MRREYTLSEEQLERLLEAGRQVPYLVIGGVVPRSPHEKANAVWQQLAHEMEFIWDTVEPTGKGQNVFSAEVEQALAGQPANEEDGA